jgi:hypothetical protein
MITLSEALQGGRLSEFIEQEETRGVGPASKRKRGLTPPSKRLKESGLRRLPRREQPSR